MVSPIASPSWPSPVLDVRQSWPSTPAKLSCRRGRTKSFVQITMLGDPRSKPVLVLLLRLGHMDSQHSNTILSGGDSGPVNGAGTD